MNQIEHKHDWHVLTSAQYTDSGKDYPAIFECRGCKLKLHASDAIQFQLLKFTTGWSKWLSIIAIIISVVSLVFSVYFLFRNSAEENMVFENNLKCAQHIEEQNNNVNEIADLPINKAKIVTAPKVFFSPKLNTCVSAFSIYDPQRNGISSFYINNLLNNDSILSEGGRKDETIDGVSLEEIAETKYYEKIRELGGD